MYIYIHPIGSMVHAIYGIHGSHQYTPFMLAYIPAPWILWDIYIYNVHIYIYMHIYIYIYVCVYNAYIYVYIYIDC